MIKRLKLQLRRFIKKRFSLVEAPKHVIDLEKVLTESVKIVSTEDTLAEIKKTIEEKKRGAYQRFGDGDIFLLNGKDEQLQRSDPKLAIEMQEAFMINSGTIHKSLPIHSHLFGFDPGMEDGNHLIKDYLALNFLKSVESYFVGKRIYSAVALHYSASHNRKTCIDFLLFLKAQNPIFVGNAELPQTLLQKLFGYKIIGTPNSNSYSEIDQIDNELSSLLKKEEIFKVVVIAMGCAGRILQKRILKKGFNCYMFDFGSLLDAFAGLESREWIRKTGPKHLKTLLDEL